MPKEYIKKVLCEAQKQGIPNVSINNVIIMFDTYEIEDNCYINFYKQGWSIGYIDMDKIQSIE